MAKRDRDLAWYTAQRPALAALHPGQWLVVHGGELKRVLATEQEAIEYALTQFGIDEASVFAARERDPFVYIGSLRGSIGTGA